MHGDTALLDAPMTNPSSSRRPTPAKGPELRDAHSTSGVKAMTALFAGTMFFSALLLFSVQPMVGKMILPILGGTPAVWNTCMVFFQAALLAGYAYAHGSVSVLGTRTQPLVHALVVLIPFAFLPIALRDGAPPPTDASPIGWLLWNLCITVGPAFLVVSTSAPLLQRWFADTSHPAAGDPYFLYAASNAGSLLALLAYPFIFEPAMVLQTQTKAWSIGYGTLVVLTIACGAAAWAWRSRDRKRGESRIINDSGPITANDRLSWILYALVPSSLMLGVTAHITTDIAAVPLLWVVPLALYLLTFVLVFARRQIVTLEGMSRLLPFVFIPLAALTIADLRLWSWLLAPIHMLAFFVAAMICHGRLAQSRPAPRFLTEYFLLISVGGVLGGLFNAMLAPQLFDRIIEYPLMLVVACMLRPRERGDASKSAPADVLLPFALAAAMLAGMWIMRTMQIDSWYLIAGVLFGLPAMICFSFKERPVRFGLSFAALLLAMGVWDELQKGGVVYLERNFYGVKRIVVDRELGAHKLFHGVTQHGFQFTDDNKNDIPLSYYHPSGPLGDLFAAVHADAAPLRAGIIGLGVGAVAAYAREGDEYHFYEIDPIVADLAEDRAYFTYLAQCDGEYEVILGDGRLKIGEARDGEYDLVMIDAFSSDAIPTHLMTREAVEIYLSKLNAEGLLVLHISNRYLAFEPMLANLADALGLAAVTRHHTTLTPQDSAHGVSPSHWLVMSRNERRLTTLLDGPEWRSLDTHPDVAIWTDQYCDIISLFRRR